MAILGKQSIQVGAENQASGGDTIYDAFTKTVLNFDKLFSCASPYTNFVAGNGISTTATSNTTIKIENTGVHSVQAGTGVTVLETNGVVTISASGNGQAGVTNVGINSSTLSIVNSPIISAGIMQVDLPALEIQPGQYVAPTVTVDQYGRVTEIANTTAIGTVTSVAVTTAGPGLAITGSPVLDDGTITITNTGVTRVNAGTGIALSGSNGNVTISSTIQSQGTVTRVDVASNTLTVLNSPITRSGTITVEIPDNITLAGNLISNTITTNTLTINTTTNVTGTVTGGNLTTAGNISGSKLTISANANVGNLGASGIVSIASTTDSNTSIHGTMAGALQVSGGAHITKNLNVGNGIVTGNVLTSNLTFGNASVNGNITWSIGTKIYTTIQGSLDIHTEGPGWSQLSYTGTTNTEAYVDASGFGINSNSHYWNFRRTGTTELPGLLKLAPLSTAPSSPSEGMIYYDSVSHALKCYDGTSWKTITMS